MSQPKPTPPRAADKIFETARDLFYREGIRAVGVDEIVARAGVTKPSLYRTFKSKDELAAAVIRRAADGFWDYFEAAAKQHPGDPRAQILTFCDELAVRARKDGYRGCPLTNAVVEYPEHGHPARTEAQNHKAELRTRLRAMAAEMGAADAQGLGDALLLLIEGAYISTQLFDEDRPSNGLAAAAERLISAYAG